MQDQTAQNLEAEVGFGTPKERMEFSTRTNSLAHSLDLSGVALLHRFVPNRVQVDAPVGRGADDHRRRAVRRHDQGVFNEIQRGNDRPADPSESCERLSTDL